MKHAHRHERWPLTIPASDEPPDKSNTGDALLM